MKKLLLLIILIIPGYFLYSYNSFKSTILTKEEQVINIKQGDTYYKIADEFNLNKNYMRFYLKFNPPKDLKAGTYSLTGGLSLEGIINSLNTPITNDVSITILPGWTIYDIDDLLTKNSLINKGELIEYNEKNIITLKGNYFFLKNASTLEGFLYPDTYNVNPNNFKLDDFIKKLLSNFDKKVIKDLEIDSSSNDFLDNIILASIVQKEANQKDTLQETKIIAGILKKRLDEDWFLGTDATICYPYEITSDECTPSFIVNHIDDVNDYNTRNMKGLTKTPICNSSADSIEAVYNSEDTPYYFYLHDNDGQVHYGKTNEEHVANKMMYIK
ncbi:MAG: endolytic transglycosylase MltG [Candidatus Gracilibacteria bacterium]|nr:endolytic transglycosylase MltG [Candidatus Gracilibacteria bacterium]